MSKNLADLRFTIRSPAGQVSATWKLWVTRHGDVYLATRPMASIEKYSFHKSGICRSAFTRERGAPGTMSDRAMIRWRRLPTPPAGEGRAACVAWLIFPTDYLSKPSDLDNREVVWVDAAPAGEATHIQISFTREPLDSVCRAFAYHSKKEILAYYHIAGDEALLVDSHSEPWSDGDLKMPGDGKVPYPSGKENGLGAL
jgi:hypothetical protein